jgi:hypothetical protein
LRCVPSMFDSSGVKVPWQPDGGEVIAKRKGFPMVTETSAGQGFLSDEQYDLLRDTLPDYLRPLFVTGYCTGVRLGELLAIRWDQVDWEQGFIMLSSADTNTGHSRAVPILDGDMRHWLQWARENADDSAAVFHRDGLPIPRVSIYLKESVHRRRRARTEIPRPASDCGPEHAPRRCPPGGPDANLGPPDGFDGAPIQHRRNRGYPVSQGADAEAAERAAAGDAPSANRATPCVIAGDHETNRRRRRRR